MRRWIATAVVTATLAVPFTSLVNASPPVTISLESSWEEADVLQQVFESVYLERSEAFFPLLDLAALGGYTEPGLQTPEARYSALLTFVNQTKVLDRPGELESLGFSLGLQEALPKLEAFAGWYRGLKVGGGEVEEEGCESWVLMGGKRWCSVEELRQVLERSVDEIHLATNGSEVNEEELPFDHVYNPSASSSAPLAVLYASSNVKSFGPWHLLLTARTKLDSNSLRYVLRWRPKEGKGKEVKRAPLSGWGVGLDIKKSDYLVVDDRPVDEADQGVAGVVEDTVSSAKGQEVLSTQSDDPAYKLDVEASTLLPLKAADVEHLGLKASQFILSSSQPLRTLRTLSQDFPRHAHSLATRWVPEEISEDLDMELLHNSRTKLEAGRSAMWLNGLQLLAEDLQPFALLRLMRKERKIMQNLMGHGLSAQQARGLLTHPAVNSVGKGRPGRDGKVAVSMLGELFVADDTLEGGEVILYWNDLEKDAKYSRWNSELRNSSLVDAAFATGSPGQMAQVARNLMNIILCLDLTQTAHVGILTELMAPIINRQLPLRWGLVTLVQEPSQEATAIALRAVVRAAGLASGLGLLELHAASTETAVNVEAFRRDAAAIIAETLEQSEPSSEEEVDALIHHESALPVSEAQALVAQMKAYAERLDLQPARATANEGTMFMNGAAFPVNDDLQTNLQQTLSLQNQFLQQQVYFGELKDDDDVGRYFYSLPGAYSRRTKFVFPTDEQPLQIVDLADIASETGLDLSRSPFIESSDPLSSMALWVIGNLNSPAGSSTIDQALQFLETDGSITLRLIHVQPDTLNPASKSRVAHSLCVTQQGSTLAGGDPAAARQEKLTSFRTVVSSDNESPVIGDADLACHLQGAEGQLFAKKIGLDVNEVAISVNGRIISRKSAFSLADVSSLVSYEHTQRIIPATVAIQEIAGETPLDRATVAMSIWSALTPAADLTSLFVRSSLGRTLTYKSLEGKHSSFASGAAESAIFEFGVVIDPVSEMAQTWSTLLEVMSERQDVAMSVWLNPSRQLKEVPIRRFYRSSLANQLAFDSAGLAEAASVVFQNMPDDILMSLTMDMHPSWIASPKDSIYDLDNIQLAGLRGASAQRGVEARFELDYVLVEGHARELPGGAAPRGLQLELQSLSSVPSVDTIVMANLGYFQLKAKPGLHLLQIRAGKSSEIYETADSDSKYVASTSFEGLTLYPAFRKREGMAEASIIEAEVEPAQPRSTGLFEKIKHLANPIISKGSNANPSPTPINIFTVASGLLYERMAYLMCISVMRHTKNPVKFWFISQFLSPSFHAFIPHLAKEYGFEYEMITYQWPRWLRAQKEKQRTIWGYKILFLDVLFPLELERVIFVDSDQIVRADLAELADMDLEGAPYAYAPMGNDREETKGFAFWNSGYWKESLNGRPYHISALYIVDLKRFRQIAAGDQLRQHYQTLSADPNSLANLDQDLPNNMQSILPIHTLDRNWLWCETWCSDESLAQAKTIDLCNNPLTHEAKLDRARRLIPEWNVYDAEVAALARRVRESEAGEVGMLGEAVEQLGQAQQQQGEYAAHQKDEL